MCLAAASLVSVLSSVVGYAAEAQAASAEAAFRQQQFEQAEINSNRNFLNQAVQQNLRISQEEEGAFQQRQGQELERARAVASARAAASGAGVSGISVDALLADYNRSSDARDQTSRRNLAIFRQQSGQELEGFRAQAISRTASAVPQPVQRPSIIGTGLTILGQGIEGYQNYRQTTAGQRTGLNYTGRFRPN